MKTWHYCWRYNRPVPNHLFALGASMTTFIMLAVLTGLSVAVASEVIGARPRTITTVEDVARISWNEEGS